MSALLILIILLSGIDAVFIAFYKISKILRRKNSKSIVLDSGIKSKMLNTISEMNSRINDYEKNTVHTTKFNDLVKKYNLLLNSHRELSKKNDTLKSRIEKLKQKIY
jgi:peptidoglycan hydrolase CwlO-like protein